MWMRQLFRLAPLTEKRVREILPFFDEKLLVNELTLDAMDNISKEPDFKKCAVRVQKA